MSAAEPRSSPFSKPRRGCARRRNRYSPMPASSRRARMSSLRQPNRMCCCAWVLIQSFARRRDDALHSPVLHLELLEADEIADLEPGVLIAPATDRVGMNAVLAGQIGRWRASVEFLEDPPTICTLEKRVLFRRVSLPRGGWNSQFQPEQFPRLTSWQA
jgi:hypothetical protein